MPRRFRANITDNHLAALLAVWRLTNATAQAVAIAQHMPHKVGADYWKRYLNDLHAEGWVVSKTLQATSRSGSGGRKLGTLYALTRQGAETIAEHRGEDMEAIFYPKGGIYASSPFMWPHRAEFIELMARFLGHEKASIQPDGVPTFEVLDLIPYFRHEGSNRSGAGKALTAVEVPGAWKSARLIPDAVMRFRVGDVVRLAVIELHRETDTRAIIEQLRKHAAAIDAGLFSTMFNHPSPNHVLSIHADVDKLRRVRECIEAGELPSFERYAAGFHFSTLAGIEAPGLLDAFWHLTREPSNVLLSGK